MRPRVSWCYFSHLGTSALASTFNVLSFYLRVSTISNDTSQWSLLVMPSDGITLGSDRYKASTVTPVLSLRILPYSRQNPVTFWDSAVKFEVKPYISSLKRSLWASSLDSILGLPHWVVPRVSFLSCDLRVFSHFIPDFQIPISIWPVSSWNPSLHPVLIFSVGLLNLGYT